MSKNQRTFTREFKLEAVQLAQASEKPFAHIARDLGIADTTRFALAATVCRARRPGLSRQWAPTAA